MPNYIKNFLGIFSIFFFLSGVVQADCIVTTKNFSKSSRVLYVNPTNGSDQLAKIYNYNLSTLRNPYEPKQIVAFQNINEAIAAQKVENGDLILIKTGSSWTKYDVAKRNVASDFNKLNTQISSYTQQQCAGENLTWVPSAVTEEKPSQNTTVTEFVNTTDITVAKAETVESNNAPTTNYSAESTQGSSTSSTGGKKSSGGSSSGGSSTNSNSSPSDNLQIGANQSTENTRILQQKQNTSSVKNNTDKITQDIITEPALPETEQESVFEPNIPEEVIADIGNEQTVPENETEIIDSENLAECSPNAPWQHAIKTYPKDNNGWSIIKPDIETKIVYVSSSEGDDNLGQAYSGLGMDDPFNPSNIQAYKTIEKAYGQVRDGKPDWILLKKGDKFELEQTLWLKTGKSQTAHIVFGAYGDKNAKRPIVDSKSNNTLQGLKNRSYNTIVGIEFYASTHDPSSPNFIGWGNKGNTAFTNLASNVNGDRFVRGLHIENNRFNYYSGGIVLGSMGPAISTNIVIRRNEILNSYSSTSHSQGMFLSQVDHALIEENILDHNGWYQQRPLNVAMNTKENGYATMFNHNIYVENSNNMVLQKNLSSRPSSIGMKFTSNASNITKINTIESSNILLIDNLFIEGEIGISLGGNTDYNNGYRWDNIQVVNNVLSNIGRSRPTNRNISWNIGAFDWKSGNICGNLIMDQTVKEITNAYAVNVSGDIGEVSVHHNTIVNVGISKESYQELANDKLSDIGNIYISDTNTNFLEQFIPGTSYKEYIDNTLTDLQNNPYKRYFEVEEAIKFLKSQAISERQNFIMKN